MRCRELDTFKILGFICEIVWKLFGFFLKLLGNFWNFLGFFLEDFFLEDFFWSNLFTLELTCLSRFWGNERRKEGELLILRSTIASSSHLKICKPVGHDDGVVELAKGVGPGGRGSVVTDPGVSTM